MGWSVGEGGLPSSLRLYHFGYHMLIVPPSVLMFWLYNYDGTSTTEPLSLTVQFLRQGERITHFIYTMLLVGIWGAFIGSVIGGIAGMVLFSFVPIIGSLLGGLGGAAAGAFLMELSYADRGPGRAAMAAVGAAVGRTAGLLMKLSIGVAIWVLFVVAALF